MGQQKVKLFDAESGKLRLGKERPEGAKNPKEHQKKKWGQAETGKKAGDQGRKGEQERKSEHAEKMQEQRLKGKDVNYIVRIANKDLNGTLTVRRALTEIKGVSARFAAVVENAFERQSGISGKLLGEIPEEKCKMIEDILSNPTAYGIPQWMLNHRKDFETGKDTHLLMADIDFDLRQVKQRLGNIKSYRGLRHVWKLPVRGQKTRSTHRGKGGVVGVTKKDVQKAKGAGSEGK